MANGQSSVDTDRSGNKTVSPFTLEELRVAVARRRIEQRQTAKWVGNRSRREKVRTLSVCIGTLLLMAMGLCLGLSHQDATSPDGSAEPIGAAGSIV